MATASRTAHGGARRLDAITNEQVQKLKLSLTHRVPKTVNNVLTLLNTLLKKAVEWNELERLPCTIRFTSFDTVSVRTWR